MKLSKERIGRLAEGVIARLEEAGCLQTIGAKRGLTDTLERVITEELMVEDRLHAEIRELMKQYADEIERGRVDYQKMFTMIKSKLVRERGLVL